MKLKMISLISLLASIGLCGAETIDQPPPTPTRSFTTEYPAFQPFRHTLGDTSYMGYYFNGRPSNCSVLIWSKPADEPPAERKPHEQVRLDLNPRQTITFFVDQNGSNLSLECSADAKSLSVIQTSVPLTQ
jgi:hypothetical protein